MPNVPAPGSAGAVASLRARNDVSVVFVAHVGLEDLVSPAEIWRKLPLRRHMRGTYWSIPPDAVPNDPADIRAWLFNNSWTADSWIADHRPAADGVAPSPARRRERGQLPYWRRRTGSYREW